MKTKKLGKKLVLNKKTVANSNQDEMKKLKGGVPAISNPGGTCPGQIMTEGCY